jgi:hypothetical protein
MIFRYSYKKHSEDAKNKMSESKKKIWVKGKIILNMEHVG